MADLSDGFVALPGGAGTMEELFEVWTWALLGLHAKPIGLLDVNGFYDPLAAMLDHMVDRGLPLDGQPRPGRPRVRPHPAPRPPHRHDDRRAPAEAAEV